MADSLLDISTAVERPTIQVDGVAYQMRSPNELGLDTAHDLSVLGRKLERLMAKDKLSPEERADLRQIASDTASTVLVDFPAEVMQRLPDMAKLKIAQVFSERLGLSQT